MRMNTALLARTALSAGVLALAACETEDPLARLAVLMHDAHEFVTGDQITPFKQAVMAMVRSNPIETIQVRIQTAIDIAAGMHGAMMRFRAVIKTADLLALAIEKRDLMADEPQSWGVVTPDVRDHALTAIPDSEDGAQTRFITQFHKLASAAAVIPMDTFYMDGGKLP